MGNWPPTGYGYINGGWGVSLPSMGPGVYPSAGGAITATFRWNYRYGNPPTDGVYVSETCTAQAESTSPAVPSANNGLSSGTSTTTSGSQTTITCTGIRVQHISNPGNSFTVTASPSASGTIGISVVYSAAIITKLVTINSSVDESFHKGSNGQPVTDLSNVATPRWGDTWVDPSSWQYDQSGNVIYVVSPTFTEERIGVWNAPTHRWTTSQAVVNSWNDDLFFSWTSIPPEWHISPDALAQMGTGAPLVITVNLTLTDHGGGMDGQSATAVYNLIIHNPYENWVPYGIQGLLTSQTVQNFTIASPGYSRSTGTIQCTWYNGGAEWGVMQPIQAGLVSISATVFANPIYKAGFLAAAIGLSDLGPKPDNGVAPWAWAADYSSIGGPFSTITGGNWNSDQTLFGMIPRLEKGYTLNEQMCDAYGPHGYLGHAYDMKAKPNDHYYWVGDFYLNSTLGGG